MVVDVLDEIAESDETNNEDWIKVIVEGEVLPDGDYEFSTGHVITFSENPVTVTENQTAVVDITITHPYCHWVQSGHMDYLVENNLL